MVFHPTVSPSVSLVDDIWFGLANHYIKGTVVGTRYVRLMQCLSPNHILYVYPWISGQCTEKVDWSVMVLRSPEELSVCRSGGSVVAEAVLWRADHVTHALTTTS
jgi:hypothetical protein